MSECLLQGIPTCLLTSEDCKSLSLCAFVLPPLTGTSNWPVAHFKDDEDEDEDEDKFEDENEDADWDQDQDQDQDQDHNDNDNDNNNDDHNKDNDKNIFFGNW